jgi:phage/plasmid-associated DNA primase
MISCNETERGAAVDDSRVKLLADGGRMSGRQLYQQEQMINLVGKCMVYSNFMLKMGMGDDIALCDRVIGIQYKMRFVSDPDPSKPHELLRSSKRVLKFKEDPNAVGTWLCIGAAMAMKDIKATGALHRPQIINDETNE